MTKRLQSRVGRGLLLALAGTCLAGEPAPEKDGNAKARAAAARKVYEHLLERYKLDPNFQNEPERSYLWSRRWMEAERQAAGTKAGRVAAVEGHLERMKKWEKVFKEGVERGIFSPGDVAAAEFYRLEAEGWLAEEKAR
jgi:hypothetical protein